MRKLILSLAFFSVFCTANAQRIEDAKTTKKEVKEEKKIADATIDFESKVVDYGVLENKADGARKFVFKNNGTEPLIIKNAKGSCGCTVPTWPREPIAPGATGEIGVNYDTKRVGVFTKTITLTTNADKKPVILTIKGEVKPPPKETQNLEKKMEGAPLEKK
ncbi:MAG: DUF1573 domain-containing protein [Bacteroidota bacterium]|nr:DUF1573 domain-containing protein [Bacteroidota bacterium]